MKITTIKSTPKHYNPITIQITCETEEDTNILRCLLSRATQSGIKKVINLGCELHRKLDEAENNPLP